MYIDTCVYEREESKRANQTKENQTREKTHRNIQNNPPHPPHPLPSNPIQPLQLPHNRPNHKQRLRKPEPILRIKDAPRLLENLPVDPQQRRLQRSIKVQLDGEGVVGDGGDEGEAVDAVAEFAGEGEEVAFWWWWWTNCGR